MNGEQELDALSREIKKIVDDNKKFLDKVMDEEFEPEEGEDQDPPEIEL